MVYLDLIFNLALLVALSVVSGFLDKRFARETRQGQLLQGLLFGVVTVLGMLRPLVLGPGLIFDGRSVMLSLCALYFGPWAAAAAGAAALVCRILLGGMGLLTGSLVIASSLALGLATHYRWKPSLTPPGASKLLLLGLAVHAAMLALMLTLPGGAGWSVIQRIGPPVLLFFPLATLLAGKILSDHLLMMQSAAALSESEERYRLLFEASPDAVMLTTPDGRILSANPAACRLLGRSEEDIIASGRDGVMDREDPRLAAALAERERTGKFAGELTMVRKDGARIPVEISTSVFRDRFGQARTSLIIRDITRRLQEEEPVKRLQALLAETQRLSKIGGWEHDLTTGRGRWTEEVYTIYGLSPDAHPSNEEAIAFYAPEDRPIIASAFARLLETGEPYDLVLKFNRASGESLRVRTIGQAEWKNGKIVRVFGNIMDVTDRVRTEEALRESEELFRNLFMHHEAVKLILDPETGSIIDANDAAAKFYGWPRETLLTMKIFEINTLSETEIRRALEIVRDQERTRFQFRHRRADGSIRDVEIFSSRIDVKGKALLHSIITDISERKEIESRQQRLLSIVDSSLNEIYIFDAETLRFEYVNQGALRNIGFSLEEMRSMTPLDIKPSFTPQTFAKMLEALRQGLVQQLVFETDHRRKDQTLYPVEVHLQLYSGDGRSIFFAIISDISERKAVETRILRINEELEQKVQERTAELQKTIRQLEETNKIFIGRELRMIELKKRIEELEGRPAAPGTPQRPSNQGDP